MIQSEYLNRRLNASPLSSLLVVPIFPHFTIAEVNSAYLKITGAKAENLVGKSIFKIFPLNSKVDTCDIISDLRKSLLIVLSSAVPDTITIVGNIFPFRKNNKGSIRCFEIENTPISGDDGKIEMIVHSITDVTENNMLQQKQEELAENALILKVPRLKSDQFHKSFNNTAWKIKEKKKVIELLADKEFRDEKQEKRKRVAELRMANKELAFQTREKSKQAAELTIVSKELVFQTEEKGKIEAELLIANKELVFQNIEKKNRAAELFIADRELIYQNKEKLKKAAELIIANIELVYQNGEKEKRAAELKFANKVLILQHKAKEIQAAALIKAYKELAIQNKEKEESAAEHKKDEEYIGHLAAIVESTDDAIISKSLDGIINSWNKGSEKMFGYTVKETMGKHISLIIPPEYISDEKLIVEKILNNEIVVHYETVRNKKSGEQFYVSLTVSALKDRAGNVIGISKIVRDITVQKKSEAALKLANDRLAKQNEEMEKRAAELLIANKELAYQNNEKEKRAAELIIANEELAFQNNEKEKRAAELIIANKELEQFAFIASHDLQQPLRTVANYMKVFEEDYLELLDDNARKYLRSVNNATKRMSILIKSILDFSRLGRNTQTTWVDCKKLVEEVIDDLEIMIKSCNAILVVTALPQLNLYEIEMGQVFQNLITNAIKFRKKNDQLKIQISCEKMNDKWRFSVRDNGIGIAPADFERVFEIFQRLHGSDEYEGNGIGLANCKKIIYLHGGEIWIESKPGEETTFYFTIPNLAI